jgi:predicted transposase/invertase (TIGR01784 family)
MPNFTKTEDELQTRLDKWLYFIKHLRDFQNIPQIFRDDVFIGAFEKAEVANYTPEERVSYDYSLKVYWDLKNVIDSATGAARKEARAEALAEGIAEGIAAGIAKVAKAMKKNGISINIISKTTGLSENDIEALRVD